MEELADKFLLSVDSGFGSKLAAEKLAVKTLPWGLEGFQVQNILFVLVERAGDRTAFSAFLGVEGEHTSDCLEEIVAVQY